MNRTRSERRHFLRKAKDRARYIGRYIWKKFVDWNTHIPIPPGEEDPRTIGIDASTHCKPCSNPACCGNPRRYKTNSKDAITKQEKLAELKELEQLEEYWSEDE